LLSAAATGVTVGIAAADMARVNCGAPPTKPQRKVSSQFGSPDLSEGECALSAEWFETEKSSSTRALSSDIGDIQNVPGRRYGVAYEARGIR
jgi:hypothetical protein